MISNEQQTSRFCYHTFGIYQSQSARLFTHALHRLNQTWYPILRRWIPPKHRNTSWAPRLGFGSSTRPSLSAEIGPSLTRPVSNDIEELQGIPEQRRPNRDLQLAATRPVQTPVNWTGWRGRKLAAGRPPAGYTSRLNILTKMRQGGGVA
jgi:hypothetical protein